MEAQPTRISRRAYLRRSVAVVSGLVAAALLQACSSPAPDASPTAAPAPAKPTLAPSAAATTAPAGAAPTTAAAAAKPAAGGAKRGGLLRLALNQEPTARFAPQFSLPMVSQHHF